MSSSKDEYDVRDLGPSASDNISSRNMKPFTESELLIVNLTEEEMTNCPKFGNALCRILVGFLYPLKSMIFTIRYLVCKYIFFDLLLFFLYVIIIFVLGFGLSFLLSYFLIEGRNVDAPPFHSYQLFVLIGCLGGLFLSVVFLIGTYCCMQIYFGIVFWRLSNIIEQIMKGGERFLPIFFCPRSDHDISFSKCCMFVMNYCFYFVLKYLMHKLLIISICSLLSLLPVIGIIVVFFVLVLELGHSSFSSVFCRKNISYFKSLEWTYHHIDIVFGLGLGNLIIYLLFPLNIFFFFFADVSGTICFVHLEWYENTVSVDDEDDRWDGSLNNCPPNKTDFKKKLSETSPLLKMQKEQDNNEAQVVSETRRTERPGPADLNTELFVDSSTSTSEDLKKSDIEESSEPVTSSESSTLKSDVKDKTLDSEGTNEDDDEEDLILVKDQKEKKDNIMEAFEDSRKRLSSQGRKLRVGFDSLDNLKLDGKDESETTPRDEYTFDKAKDLEELKKEDEKIIGKGKKKTLDIELSKEDLDILDDLKKDDLENIEAFDSKKKRHDVDVFTLKLSEEDMNILGTMKDEGLLSKSPELDASNSFLKADNNHHLKIGHQPQPSVLELMDYIDTFEEEKINDEIKNENESDEESSSSDSSSPSSSGMDEGDRSSNKKKDFGLNFGGTSDGTLDFDELKNLLGNESEHMKRTDKMLKEEETNIEEEDSFDYGDLGGFGGGDGTMDLTSLKEEIKETNGKSKSFNASSSSLNY